MRAVLVLGIFLLGFGVAAREPEYASLNTDYFHVADAGPNPSLIEIESSLGRSDRLTVASPLPSESADDSPHLATAEAPPSPALENTDIVPESTAELSLNDLCSALLTSAEDNNLPVPFFANLIWQESRLRDDAVSPVGALGIAQFMPRVAMESGLDNPFDPLEAIPASARLLRELRQHFGNLGFVAAAYNAGARRVTEWLKHRRALPRETRGYVIQVTGRSAEQWRTTPPDDASLKFVRRLPCRDLPAFADLEQAQREEVQPEQVRSDPTESQPPQAPEYVAMPAHRARWHFANHEHRHTHLRHEFFRAAVHTRPAERHEAVHHQHAMHERRRRA